MIHHYTSISSLALILSSGKIRFKRLDLLDDIKEINGLPEFLIHRFFVSCWTEDNEENISLWSLYTGMKGVRVSFPNKFYKEHLIPKGNYGNWGYGMDLYTPLSLDGLRTDSYVIGNYFWLDDGFFVGKVIYDKNFIEIKKKSITHYEDTMQIDKLSDLVLYKDPIWSFQKESRFYLHAVPLPPLENYNGNREEQMLDVGKYFQINPIDHIDLEIDDHVLDSIVVRMHPGSEEADKIIVKSLLEKFTSNGKLELSHLENTYRRK